MQKLHTKNMNNCKKLQKNIKLQKIAKKFAIFLKIAKKRGRDFPEGQVVYNRSTILFSWVGS